MKRIRIEPLTNGQYTISETNPNPGGETLESPYGATDDIRGPYLVFNRAQVTTSGRLLYPVISLGTAKAAVVHVENGGEVGQAGSGRPADEKFDGGEPTDKPDYVTLRSEYQILAAHGSLLELPSWDEFLAEKGLEPDGSPTASSTRRLDQTGIDPTSKDLTAVGS